MIVFPTEHDNLKTSHLNNSKTFSYMVTLIQDEIDDTTDEYSVQIQDSIFTALRVCEREPCFFNEKKEVTFKTQSGKMWYGQEEGIFIESERAIESVLLGTCAATQKKLLFKSVKELRQEYNLQSEQGTPLFYSYVDKKIGIFPISQQAETVRLSYSLAFFGERRMIKDSDPWLIYAFDLIKARAKYELYKNILKDPEYAAVSFRDFQEQLQALRFETSRRKGASNIVPMRF
ncbi:hypothetical protein [Bartonella sp. CB169]|uniref:hypothetical protein n=1 Tax=Bartonella sp. CB169 TaxID=3112257 RepID=UPI00300E470D